MVRVRLREDGPQSYRNRDGVYADRDDPEVDVDEEMATYLVDDVGAFEFVDDPEDDEEDADESADNDEAVDVQEPPFDPAEYDVDELRDELDAGEYDDGELEALAHAEAGGEDRSTALDAINRHREE